MIHPRRLSLGPRALVPWLLLAMILLVGCSKSLPNPLDTLTRDYKKYPEFSVILDDMQVTGNFVKSYYHYYKVLYVKDAAASGDTQFSTEERGWVEVPKDFYRGYETYLGMTILSKKNGQQDVSRVQQPAAYQYVGNERYGRWQSNPSGGNFWVFYGQYSLLRDLLGGGSYPIRRSHWNDYRGAYRSGRPYFGPSSSPYYGTSGTLTKTKHPTFFERQQLRQSAKSQRFSQRVSSRVGRTQSRGSGRFGGK